MLQNPLSYVPLPLPNYIGNNISRCHCCHQQKVELSGEKEQGVILVWLVSRKRLTWMFERDLEKEF